MPALVTGTVVLWRRDDSDEKNPTVILESAEPVWVYAPDDATKETIRAKIVSTYIERQKISDKEKLELWKRFGEGSLQVVELRDTDLTLPPVSVMPKRPATGTVPPPQTPSTNTRSTSTDPDTSGTG
jgi:hypothetical protein